MPEYTITLTEEELDRLIEMLDQHSTHPDRFYILKKLTKLRADQTGKP